jgi:hypothetical protein
MDRNITLSDNELEFMQVLIEQELSRDRVEYRRTRTTDFKESLERDMESMRHLLEKVQQARKAA